MGTTLLQTIEQLIDWADSHVADIYAARAEYDARHAPCESAAPAACGPEEAAAEPGACDGEDAAARD
jgi:hypothetical protein